MAKTDMLENFSEITDVLKNYIGAKVNLLKLGLLQKITRAGTYLLTFFSVILSIFAITIFLMLSFSSWYGDVTGNLAHGFLISAAFFLFILFLIYLLRKVIFSRNLIKGFSQIIFTDDED
jgi:hypothetical protein